MPQAAAMTASPIMPHVIRPFEVFRFALGSLALRFIQRGARLRILGDISRFPKDIAQKSLEMIQKSKKNSQITVTFALNYGGRDEILRAVKKIVKQKDNENNRDNYFVGE